MSNPYFHPTSATSEAGTFHYPIIFIRGYAMRSADIEETVNEPFSGFEKGSTKYRQGVDGDIRPYYFESPVLRLAVDSHYEDVYRDGGEPTTKEAIDEFEIPEKSLWVYRYYEQASKDFGDSERDEIEVIAEGLDDMVERLRALFSGLDQIRGTAYGENFKVRLVAHSMGGLIVRSYLQKVFPERYKKRTGKKYTEKNTPVDKVFTYGTPHNGIEVRVLGNQINLGLFDISNFFRPKIARFLGLTGTPTSVNSLDGKFPPDRFFCLIGTNERDYNVAASRVAVGPLSDGLVRIANAWIEGSPRAHVHRAHGGPLGMVNSEDGYQNLTRFFFGDTRVDGALAIDEISLPEEIQAAREEKKEIHANFYFDNVVSVRGTTGWSLTRRKLEENSAVRREFGELFSPTVFKKQTLSLFSAFLDRKKIVVQDKKFMVFELDLAVLVDGFTVERKWLPDPSFEGATVFSDRLLLEVAPPVGNEQWRLRYRFRSTSSEGSYKQALVKSETGGEITFEVPVVKKSNPGFKGTLLLTARNWL